jgi:hypothetical protein
MAEPPTSSPPTPQAAMLQIVLRTLKILMAFISVTRLRVRSFTYLPQFVWRTLQIVRETENASGFLGGKLLREAQNTFWTVTAWEDEPKMNAFRIAGSHLVAMTKLLDWCDEASVAHWHQETPRLPTWLEAHRRMISDGRLSKVNHPSSAQLANRFPSPQPSRIERTLRRAP